MSKKKKSFGIHEEKLLKEMTQKSMRSNMIVCAAVADNLLEQILLNHFVHHEVSEDILEDARFLQSFSSKIKMAFCLGLISEHLYKDLDILKKIRNKCAHSLVVSEDHGQSIKDLVKNYYFLHTCFEGTDCRSLDDQMVIAFMPVLCALLKKLKNVERLNICDSEIGDLGFDESDWKFIEELRL